jgi:DNA endonuclease I-hmuI
MNKKEKIFDIPDLDCYGKIKIDNFKTVYIFEDGKLIEIIPYSRVKFFYNNKTYYILELFQLTFYGVKNRFKFTEIKKLNDIDIEINGVKFRKIYRELDDYYISETGLLYSTNIPWLMKHIIDEDGYHRITLYGKRKGRDIGIHRLVYSTWVGEIPDGYVIDHKDNIKWNNDVKNLSAMTVLENTRKAANDGLMCHKFHWTDKIVEEVCKLMQDNISVQEIAAKFNVYPEDKKDYKNFRNQLYHIRKGDRGWKDISCKYDFSKYDGNIRPDSKFRNSEIKEMRSLYNTGMSPNIIAIKFNTDNNQHFRNILRGKMRKII